MLLKNGLWIEENDSFAGIIQIKFNRMISDQCHVKPIFSSQLRETGVEEPVHAFLATGSSKQFYLCDHLTILRYLNAFLLTEVMLWNVVLLSFADLGLVVT